MGLALMWPPSPARHINGNPALARSAARPNCSAPRWSSRVALARARASTISSPHRPARPPASSVCEVKSALCPPAFFATMCWQAASCRRESKEGAMADQFPQGEPQAPGLIEYALIVALVAVLVIGILIVLAPAIATIVNTVRGG